MREVFLEQALKIIACKTYLPYLYCIIFLNNVTEGIPATCRYYTSKILLFSSGEQSYSCCQGDAGSPGCCVGKVRLDIVFLIFFRALKVGINSAILTLIIEHFHLCGPHLCKFILTRESIYVRNKSNFHRIGFQHQHNHYLIV